MVHSHPATAVYASLVDRAAADQSQQHALIIQVLVTPNRVRGQADQGNVGRLLDEARVITVKTRKAQ